MTKPIGKWILIRTLVLTVGLFLLLAVTDTGGNGLEFETEKAHRISESALQSLINVDPTKNGADLKFSYGKRNRFRGSAPDSTVLISQQAVYHVVGDLKKQIALPFKIQVLFKDCGDPDSYYDEDSHEIVICYELIDVYSELFSRTVKAKTARDEAAKGAIVSIFLHEVAHALIDGWDLSITGREEDAADQFATLMLINALPDGERMAMDSARSFKSLALVEKGLEKDYSDPHSVDEQRFYNTICLLYGHRPERYEYLIRNGSLPAERAFLCEEDYARVNKSWQKLLAPHFVHLLPGDLTFSDHNREDFGDVDGYFSFR
jgi:hypothetical protein